MPVVRVIPQKINPLTKQGIASIAIRRVAAYARVSTDSDEQFTSFEAQVDYYTKKINDNPNWEFVKVYADEGITGTNIYKREAFNQMINDALNGKIDLILTKSVSRFARNTVDSIITIRKLKEKGVEVYFEKENIYTLDSKGELLLTIMSSLAQEESRSISENVIWAFRKRFKDGKLMMSYKHFLGYDKGKDGKPVINKEDEIIVKKIYRWFLEGMSTYSIAEKLNSLKIPMPSKKKDSETGEFIFKWQCSTVLSILTNEKYKGEAILQKTVTVDFLSHKKKKNEGEAPQYHVTESHEAIIDPVEWEMVQEEIKRRGESKSGRHSAVSIFASKLICGDCGSYYGQKVWHSTDKYRKLIFRCNQKFSKKNKCYTPTLCEEDIKKAFIQSLNQLDNDYVVDDLLNLIEEAKDTSKIDKEIAKTKAELDAVIELATKMVNENASTALDQEDYQKKYKILVDKSDEHMNAINHLENQKKNRMVMIGRANLLIETIQNKKEAFRSLDERLWSLLVEKAIVNRDGSLKFIYYAGYENIVKL